MNLRHVIHYMHDFSQSIQKGEMFSEEGCTQQCQCLGNGQTQCSAWSCADHEVCKDKDGVKGCFHAETVTCSVYGDPHYITYDQRAYNFQGGCNYTLATTCGEQSPVRFTVTGRNSNPDQSLTRSKLDTVVLHIEELHLTLNQNGNVYVSIDRIPDVVIRTAIMFSYLPNCNNNILCDYF